MTEGPVATRTPRVVVATSHFPRFRRGDVAGNFVVDPLLALAGRVDFQVVTPIDEEPDTPLRAPLEGRVPVHRFRYWPTRRGHQVAYRRGVWTNLQESWLARLQLPLFALAFVVTILRHARHADVVHAHWLPVALLALPARWLFRVPVVVTLHGTDITQFPTWFTRFGLRRMDAIVTAHEDLHRDASQLAPRVPLHQVRHLVEPQPVEDAAVTEVRSRLGDGPVALFVARLSPERDPLSFVRAADVARRTVPDARFAIVGMGALEGEVEQLIDELDLRDHVVAFGYRPDVWTFLRVADCFAALSDRNNIWVTAVVEAMRAGLPVVATTAGDTADELVDGVHALLVPVGDVAAIGDALARLLADPQLRTRVADGARRRLEEAGFDPDRVKDETVALYRSLAAGRRAGERAGR
jgi:glycosyltransferase involved in cell wall biosynthesis